MTSQTDRDAVELAACPFCGGAASLVDNRPIGLCYCICDECDATGGGAWESERLAREEWNRRTPPVPMETPRGEVINGERCTLHGPIARYSETCAACECNDGEPTLYRAGKKAAGRLLDGVLHDGFPEGRS